MDGGVLDGDWRTDDVVPLIPGRIAEAVLVGQAVALGRLVLAMVANPLTAAYLRSQIAEPPQFVPGPVPGEPDPVGEVLVARGLWPAVTVSDHVDEPATIFDLYQSSEQLVTAAVSRATGSVSILSGLSDGRILHTAALQVVPSERMVVNTVARGDAEALMASHRSLLGVLAIRGVRPVEATTRLWLDAAESEAGAYRALGPFLGALVNLTGGPALGRMLVRVPPEHVLDLAVPASASRRGGTSRLAVAFGAAGAVPAEAS